MESQENKFGREKELSLRGSKVESADDGDLTYWHLQESYCDPPHEETFYIDPPHE